MNIKGNSGSDFSSLELSPLAGNQVYTVKVESIGDGRWRYHMSVDEKGRGLHQSERFRIDELVSFRSQRAILLL